MPRSPSMTALASILVGCATCLAFPNSAAGQASTGRYLSQEECRFRELPVGDYAGFMRRYLADASTSTPNGVAVMNDSAHTVVEWGRGGESTRPAILLQSAGGLAFTGARAVTSGFGDACATKAAGEVFCWGDNINGARGIWEPPSLFPARFLLSSLGPTFDAVSESVAMGYGAGCATRVSDSTAYCWGYNASGMNGNGTLTVDDVPRPMVDSSGAPLRNINRFMITRSATCALASDQTLWCTGAVGSTGLLPPLDGPDTNTVAQVMLGGAPFTAALMHTEDAEDSDAKPDNPVHICATRPDGSVWCWGRNLHGALGDGTTDDRATPAPVLEGGSPLTSAATTRHALAGTCALMVDSTVRCWGDNRYGQVGDGTTQNRLSAVPVLDTNGRPLDGFIQLASLGTWTRCGLRRDNTLYCWGRNSVGEIGDGTTESKSHPTLVTCGECQSDAECALGPDPYAARFGTFCDRARARCMECTQDLHCADPARPRCDRTGERGRCVAEGKDAGADATSDAAVAPPPDATDVVEARDGERDALPGETRDALDGDNGDAAAPDSGYGSDARESGELPSAAAGRCSCVVIGGAPASRPSLLPLALALAFALRRLTHRTRGVTRAN